LGKADFFFDFGDKVSLGAVKGHGDSLMVKCCSMIAMCWAGVNIIYHSPVYKKIQNQEILYQSISRV
jgi:hypothetical protein